ncbi:ankyrin repeat domain-containing protein [Acidovorax sp. DW039]|uniref:ankyrin repeat domain-containing protein n=1 Tax=Acidovorax sp. DW039 TaxID=3095606 RepID=UPI0030882DC0|nr:ankyrin repeat domain-containing protein [Acidovorax sp. DW039]
MLRRRHALCAVPLWALGISALAGSYDDFFTAILRDDPDTITALLQRGFDPNTRDAKGQVGLVIALKQESFKAFAALMSSRQTKVEVRNAQDESPLMLAAIKGNLDAVKQLVARDADVNKTGWAPLHYAASGGTEEHLRIASYLLENHAYIDAASPNGTTPLMMAAQYGSTDMVKLLLEEGADPTLKNRLGLTAVNFAQRVGRTETAAQLAAAIRKRQPNAGKW